MLNLLLYSVTVLVWGSTWLAIEFQLGETAPEVSIFFRYVAASALLFGWSVIRRQRLRFPLTDHAWFAGLGVMLFGLNYVLAYHAQVHITSALTAIAFSTMLWMNILNARLFFGQRAGRGVLVGSVFGIAGIVLLFYPQAGSLTLTDQTIWGATLCIGSALVASFGNMISQGAQRRGLPVLQSNAWGMFYGALLTGTFAAAEGHEFVLDTSLPYLLSLGYLVVFGSIVAFGAYLTLLGRIGAHRSGYAMVMFPVVALALSVTVEGLQISDSLIAGVLLVIVGNLFVLQRKPRAATTPVPGSGEAVCRVARG